MTQRCFNVYVFTQGQIKEGPHGTDYDGGPPVLVRVNKGISFAELERKLFVALRLDRQHVMTITYRCPIEFVSTHIQYRRLPVIDDDTVDLITDMLEQHVELSGADLYVEVERCQSQDADEVPGDTLPSLAMVVNPNLPHVIIVDILSRLPVKSLCRFKCVSKQWHSLIRDPKFVKMHLEKAVENKDIFHERRRLVFSIEFKSLYFVNLDAFVDEIDEDVAEATELDYLFNGLPSKQVLRFISCNGLLLCQLQLFVWELYLINPSTRELKKVPEPPYHEEIYYHEEFYYHEEVSSPDSDIYGLGFDHTNNDFKVVKGRLYDRGLGFSVYSLRTDSWRVIKGRYLYALYNTFPGIVLNGGLHWLVTREGSEPCAIIMCFDVVDEKVREVQVPAEVIDPGFYLLGVVGECLCIKPYDGQKHSHFWVMKEYGVRESWNKVVITIPFELLDDSRFSKNNEDLLKIEDRLVMYNLEEGTYWDLEIRGVPKLNQAETYLESLVSPNYHHGLCGEYQAQC